MENKLNNELKNKGVIDKRAHRYGKLTMLLLITLASYVATLAKRKKENEK